MLAYISRMRSPADKLAGARKPRVDIEFISYILVGLDLDSLPFAARTEHLVSTTSTRKWQTLTRASRCSMAVQWGLKSSTNAVYMGTQQWIFLLSRVQPAESWLLSRPRQARQQR